jgi:hypothetical protein
MPGSGFDYTPDEIDIGDLGNVNTGGSPVSNAEQALVRTPGTSLTSPNAFSIGTISASGGGGGQDGEDGREIELSVSATHIRWRYVGDASWINLIALSQLQGPPGQNGNNGQDGDEGQDGREVELGTSATHIQWRYVGESWNDLIAISELKGDPGEPGDTHVPDPSGEPDNRWLRTQGGVLVYTEEPTPIVFGAIPPSTPESGTIFISSTGAFIDQQGEFL